VLWWRKRARGMGKIKAIGKDWEWEFETKEFKGKLK
jgi:hypothetical protein